MMSVTPEQFRLYRFIEAQIHETGGIAPTLVEMALHMGFSSKSKGVIHRMLTALEEKGHIRRLPRRARSIELTHLSGEFVCPACGWRGANSHGSLSRATGGQPRLGASEPANDGINSLEIGSAGQ